MRMPHCIYTYIYVKDEISKNLMNINPTNTTLQQSTARCTVWNEG